MLATGSRGDVQPYIALARGFRRAGHHVHIATSADWLPYLQPVGIEFTELPLDFAALLNSDDGRVIMARGTRPLTFGRALARLVEPLAAQTATALDAVCRDADVLIGGQIALLLGDAQLEQLGLPYIHAMLQPFTPTRDFASPMITPLPAWLPLRGTFNRYSHGAILALLQALFGPITRGVGRRIARPSRRAAPPGPRPMLYGYSPSVLPIPSDWPSHARPTGYWFLEALTEWTPPTALVEFLASGPPPMYVGFGSMKTPDARRMTDAALAALRATGQRGVLFAGHGGLERRDDCRDVMFIDATPHDWLFPRMRGVVIHGGAGTTSAALRAGRPATIVPYLADQPFWGAQVARLGVGPRPISHAEISEQTLAAAMGTMASDGGMAARAERLGEKIRAEDGVAEAVARAEEYFSPGHRSSPLPR